MSAKNLIPKFIHEKLRHFFPMDESINNFLPVWDKLRDMKKGRFNKESFCDLYILTQLTITLIQNHPNETSDSEDNLQEVFMDKTFQSNLLNLLLHYESPYAPLFDPDALKNPDESFLGLTIYIVALSKLNSTPVESYVLSKNLTSILSEVTVPDKFGNIIEQKVPPNKVHCFRFKGISSTFFKDITSYVYLDGNEFIISIFSKTARGGCFSVTSIDEIEGLKKRGQMGSLGFPLISYIDYDFLDKHYDSILSHVVDLMALSINSLLYIYSPPRDAMVEKKIIELSLKRGKRRYEESHYSLEPYSELDLNYSKVRAYEQGKTWYKRAHTRWQRCGKGNEDVKLVFLAPQNPQRRKVF